MGKTCDQSWQIAAPTGDVLRPTCCFASWSQFHVAGTFPLCMLSLPSLLDSEQNCNADRNAVNVGCTVVCSQHYLTLKQYLQAALGITGVEGAFRKGCESILAVSRRHAPDLTSLMQAVLTDPLVSWGGEKRPNSRKVSNKLGLPSVGQ